MKKGLVDEKKLNMNLTKFIEDAKSDHRKHALEPLSGTCATAVRRLMHTMSSTFAYCSSVLRVMCKRSAIEMVCVCRCR
jgi:hypothetical protein